MFLLTADRQGVGTRKISLQFLEWGCGKNVAPTIDLAIST